MGNNLGTQAEISKVALSGLWKKVPGYLAGTYMGDQQPIDNMSSNYSVGNLTGGQANSSEFLAPCDYLAASAYATIITAPGTNPATISIGVLGSLNAILNAYSIATNATLGFIDLTANAAFTGATNFNLGSQGDVIVFNTNGGGTSTGTAMWGALIVPRG